MSEDTEASKVEEKKYIAEAGGVCKRENLNPYIPTEERIKRFEVAIKAEFLKEVFSDPIDHQQSRPPEDNPPPQKKGRYSKASRKERRERKNEKLEQNALLCNNSSLELECTKDS